MCNTLVEYINNFKHIYILSNMPFIHDLYSLIPHFYHFVFYFIMIFQWKITILYHSISVEPQTFGIIYSLMLPLFKIRSIHNKQSKIVRYIALDVIVIMNPSMILNHLWGFKFSTFWQIFSSFVALHEI